MMKIKDIAKGSTGTIECIIINIEEQVRPNKNGPGEKVFLNIQVSDGESKPIIRLWNTKLSEFPYQKNQVVFMKLKAEEYNGSISYVALQVEESSADPEQFICGAPIQPEVMFTFLLKTSEKCGVYAGMLKEMLKDYKDKLLIWGAGKSVHHNIKGGLLYHTYRMVKSAAYLTSVYNKEASMLPNCRNINTELLVAGTILHDFGKLIELETNFYGDSEYTIKGTLMGHAFIGAELAGKYALKSNLSEEDTCLLQHMILSHHGKHEYHAVVIPAIPEAMILHNLDMIDSCMYQFEIHEAEIKPGEMSDMVYGLGQKVYRPTWKKEIENN